MFRCRLFVELSLCLLPSDVPHQTNVNKCFSRTTFQWPQISADQTAKRQIDDLPGSEMSSTCSVATTRSRRRIPCVCRGRLRGLIIVGHETSADRPKRKLGPPHRPTKRPQPTGTRDREQQQKKKCHSPKTLRESLPKKGPRGITQNGEHEQEEEKVARSVGSTLLRGYTLTKSHLRLC